MGMVGERTRLTVHNVFGYSWELLAQLGALRGDTDRTAVEVANARHNAPRRDHRRGAKAELLPTKQRRHHHVVTRADAAVHPHRNAVAQSVLDECALRLGHSQLPRRPARSVGRLLVFVLCSLHVI